MNLLAIGVYRLRWDEFNLMWSQNTEKSLFMSRAQADKSYCVSVSIIQSSWWSQRILDLT